MEEKKTYITVDDLVKQAEEQFKQFIKDGKYKDILLSMSNLNCYSLTNQLLILSQRPTATCVNGMKVWNYNHRNVIKGEKAIKIIAPLREIKKEDVLDDNNEVVETKEVEVIGYTVSHVFDISQTEGRELHAFKCDENTAVENFQTIKEALERVPRGFTVRYGETNPSCDGYCDFKAKEIVIKDGMSYSQTLTTLIHEIGHALAETRTRNDFNGLTPREQAKIREIEAESIALVVSNRLGLNTTDFNLGYIAKFSDGDIDKFKNNLSIVRSVSYQILSCVEPALQTHLSELAKAEQETVQETVQETQPTEEEKKPAPKKSSTKKATKTKELEVEQC